MPRPLTIKPVVTRYERSDWLEMPWKVNGSDPCWVPPLRDTQKRLAGFGHHPIWDECDGQAFLAMRGQEDGPRAAVLSHGSKRIFAWARTLSS